MKPRSFVSQSQLYYVIIQINSNDYYFIGAIALTTSTKAGPGYTLDANDFKKMILGADLFFSREKETINALNVFPVPDGDTGTNMSMTIKAAVKDSLAYEGQSIGELSEIFAAKALMGARGNSGVILSQLLKGIAHGLRKKDRISPQELSKALQFGVVYAYRAVSKPMEGTILTVAREMARGIRTAVKNKMTLHESIEAAIHSGKITLEKTPEMLPTLKEAGVVDAGGLGLLVFFEGCLFALKRTMQEIVSINAKGMERESKNVITKPVESPNIEYPYCTEMIIRGEKGSFDNLKKELIDYGDSLLVATDNRLAKIHIHTASPGLVIQKALLYGTLHDIKIENMYDQHLDAYSQNVFVENTVILQGNNHIEKGVVGIITVSFGEGFREIFASLGADEVVFGGQTMNPRVEDLLKAVNNLEQDQVIILPNNKNIILVAEQVEALSDKQVEIIKTHTLPEGLAALLAYNSTSDITENSNNMKESFGRVKTGLITYATRKGFFKDKDINPKDFLGLSGDKIAAVGLNMNDTALELLQGLIAPESDILTIFYGKETNRIEASNLANSISQLYPSLEVELQYGGQPLYYYIFSVE